MIVGILSDSHGRAQRTARAIRLLRQLGAQMLIHCGDIGSEGVLEDLARHKPAWFVWGNTDAEWAGPPDTQLARSLGLKTPDEAPAIIETGGKHIAVFHGHEPEFERLAARLRTNARVSVGSTDRVDYVLFGHTHRPADVRGGGLRLINPGALHRAAVYTVATLDLERDEVAHWIVDDDLVAGAAPRRFEIMD